MSLNKCACAGGCAGGCAGLLNSILLPTSVCLCQSGSASVCFSLFPDVCRAMRSDTKASFTWPLIGGAPMLEDTKNKALRTVRKSPCAMALRSQSAKAM